MLDMKVHRINHVGFVVNDLLTAKALFLNLGLELQGEVALKGARKARRCSSVSVIVPPRRIVIKRGSRSLDRIVRRLSFHEHIINSELL